MASKLYGRSHLLKTEKGKQQITSPHLVEAGRSGVVRGDRN